MADRNDNPKEPSFGDSRLAEFLRRATPILAAERGWNAQSRMKLKSLADDLHLPRPLFETALRQLQNQAARRSVELTRYERQFVRFLEEHLKPLTGNVMTPQFETRAIEHGQRDFQIGHDRARDLVRQVAGQLEIGRVSRLDAIEHVAALIDDAIGQATTANTAVRNRIIESAQHWGVEPEQSRILIDNRLAANLQSIQPRRSMWIIVLATLASAVVLALLAWLIWSQIGSDISRDANRKITSSGAKGSSGSPFPAVEVLPVFWSPETQRAWRQLLVSDRALVVPRHLVLSNDGADRQQAMLAIVDLALRSLEPLRQDAVQFLIRIVDEDREISEQVIQAIAARLRLAGDSETISMRRFREAFDAADLLQNCREQSTRPEIGEHVSRASTASLSLTLDSGFDLTRTAIDSRMTELAWQQLDAVAARDVEVAARLYSPLFELTQARSRDAAALAWPVGLKIFFSNGESWQLMRDAWKVTFASANDDQLFQAFDLMSKENDRDRTEWLLSVLTDRMGIERTGVPANRISDAIRTRFGLENDTWAPAEARWNLLVELPDYRVALDPDQRPTPQAIANTAWLSTAAFLMWRAEQETNSRILESFDQLIAAGPRDLSIRRHADRQWDSLPVLGRVQRRPQPADFEARRLALEKLQDPSSFSSAARAIALQRLAEIADRFPDLSYEQATAVVRVMLLATEDSEIVAIEKYTPRFRHWANMVTALSEQVMEPDVPIDQAVTVASLLTELTLDLRAGEGWRETLRRKLLRHLADCAQRTAEVQEEHSDFQWDELRDYLVELGRLRCRAVGIASSDLSTTRSPAELDRLILRHMSGDNPRIATTKLLADDELQEAILTTALLAEVVHDSAGKGRTADVGQNDRQSADCPTALLANERDLLNALVNHRKAD